MPIRHVVRQGECLSSIAAQYGFSSWKTIYDDPANASLRQQRRDPNLLMPGDEVSIPDRASRSETGGTEARHQFRRRADQTRIRIFVQDADGQPLAGKSYSLRVSGAVIEGLTGADGLIDQRVAPEVDEGELKVTLDPDSSDSALTWALKIGHLDPVATVSGVQARLNNLGLASGFVDGINGPRTKAAVKSFQDQHGLTVDGIAGPLTQAKLKEVHGC